MLAVLLEQVKLRGVEEITEDLEFLLESGDGALVPGAAASGEKQIAVLSLEQMQRLEAFSKHPIFKPVMQHIVENEDQWVPFLESDTPELAVPYPWEPSTRTFLIIIFANCELTLPSAADGMALPLKQTGPEGF